MLEFAAKEFLELAGEIGAFLGAFCNKSKGTDLPTNRFGKLLSEANRLGLVATRDTIEKFIAEVAKANPGKTRLLEEGILKIEDASVETSRLCYFAEAIQTTLQAELSAILFKSVPKERAQYLAPEWLKRSPISSKYPTSLREIKKAGECYALGQPTASVFHSVRALEPALGSLAAHFGIEFSQENWQKVIQQVESEIRKLGNQQKSQKKLEDERFFGSAASHLYFVKNAWRNHVAHTRESYSDIEALQVMEHTVQFVESLCPRLSE